MTVDGAIGDAVGGRLGAGEVGGRRRAIVYCRISRDPLGTGLGTERQERACRELCDREQMDVVAVLIDDDRSAYSGKPRPAWSEVQRRIESGDVDVLVAWAADRLTRHPRELEDLVDLLKATETRVRTVHGGELDLSTADGQMVARVVGAMARRESDAKSARLRAKSLELAQAGKVGGGGHRPFGYASDRVSVLESEAEVIRWAVREIASGDSLRSVCKRMPVPTTTGKNWTPNVLRRLLLSPRIAGLRQHRGEVIGDAIWEGVVDRKSWEQVRHLLTDPRRKTWRPSSRYLLTGGLIRDHLGRPMVARPNERGQRGYITLRDERGPGVRILADPVEAMVLDTCVAKLEMGVPLLSPTQEEAPSDEFESLEAQLLELADLRGNDRISSLEWLAAREPLTRRLEAARAALVPVVRSVDLGDVLARWEGLSFEERRRAVHAMVQEVVIFPGRRGYNRFDPYRVLIVLSFGEVVPFP